MILPADYPMHMDASGTTAFSYATPSCFLNFGGNATSSGTCSGNAAAIPISPASSDQMVSSPSNVLTPSVANRSNIFQVI